MLTSFMFGANGGNRTRLVRDHNALPVHLASFAVPVAGLEPASVCLVVCTRTLPLSYTGLVGVLDCLLPARACVRTVLVPRPATPFRR